MKWCQCFLKPYLAFYTWSSFGTTFLGGFFLRTFFRTQNSNWLKQSNRKNKQCKMKKRKCELLLQCGATMVVFLAKWLSMLSLIILQWFQCSHCKKNLTVNVWEIMCGVGQQWKLSDEFKFGPYLSVVTPILHETQISLLSDSSKRNHCIKMNACHRTKISLRSETWFKTCFDVVIIYRDTWTCIPRSMISLMWPQQI